MLFHFRLHILNNKIKLHFLTIEYQTYLYFIFINLSTTFFYIKYTLYICISKDLNSSLLYKSFSGISKEIYESVKKVKMVKNNLNVIMITGSQIRITPSILILFGIVPNLRLPSWLFSSPGQRPCELLPLLGVRRTSYVVNFHILIFSSETTGPIATKLW